MTAEIDSSSSAALSTIIVNGCSNGTNTDIDGIGDVDYYRDNHSHSTCSHYYHGSRNLYTYGDINTTYIKLYTITRPHRSL
ncbi:hypothetical protein D6C79_06806 [Aureobasidium pullulans]|nr:hypothetical protein D6C79_06806 [Aureobasidium pullulans]